MGRTPGAKNKSVREMEAEARYWSEKAKLKKKIESLKQKKGT